MDCVGASLGMLKIITKRCNTYSSVTKDGFHGIWLHFRRARVQLYARIQARKCYIKSFERLKVSTATAVSRLSPRLL